MRQPDDTKTLDLIQCDLVGEIPRKPTQREKAAERARRFRERHGVKPVTLQLRADLAQAFSEYCAAKGKKQAAVVEKLIETQLLRKR